MKNLIILANNSNNWIGGLYYKSNIIFMLKKNEWINRNIKITVVCNDYSYRFLSELFPDLEYIVDNHVRLKWLYNIKMLFKYNNSFFFPSDYLFLSKRHIAWIADFQHIHYKDFFPRYVRIYRDIKYHIIAKRNMNLVLSSNDSRNDFVNYYGGNKCNSYVLHFVSYIEPIVKNINKELCDNVLIKFDLHNKKYACVMNQFWQHKNHITVFKAIAEYFKKHRDSDYVFVFTGKMEDYRNPDYIKELKSIIVENKIESHIKLLGFIEREDQVVIMHRAEFVIQPSLFEGWGTVLEDAKVLDKTVLLSDIPVHREQKNYKSILFNPKDYDNLAELINQECNKKHEDDLKKGIASMHKCAEKYSLDFEKLLKNSYKHERC